MKISIIIPVYNEEKTIKKVVEKVKKSNTLKLKKEIIIIDDGSTDKSKSIIQKIKGVKKIFHKKNKGKGAAVINGIKKSTGNIILIQDADLEYDPENYEKLLKPFNDKKIQVVYGVRFNKNIPTKIIVHTIGNLILNALTSAIYLSKISDMETGYKIFRKNAVKKMNLKAKGFEFEPEITGKILKKGLKITEIPITFNPRSFSEGKKINWKDGVKALKMLIKTRVE